MATSGTYTFSVTRDQILNDAALNLGKLGEGQSLTPAEVSDMSFKLNMLVKQLQGTGDGAPGLKTWMRRHGHLFLQGNTSQYLLGPAGSGWCAAGPQALGDPYVSPTLTSTVSAGANTITLSSSAGISAGANVGVALDVGNIQWTTAAAAPAGNTVTLSTPLTGQASFNAQVFSYVATNQGQQPIRVEACVLRDIFGEDIPMRLIRSIQDYSNLPSKRDPTNISDPVAVYVEYQLSNSFLYIDCAGAQDVTKHLVVDYLEGVQDFNAATDNPEFPQEWFLPLTWAMSKQAAPMFRAVWTQEMELNYQEAMRIARRKEPEITTMYFLAGEDGN
jgi:hypothetical protein